MNFNFANCIKRHISDVKNSRLRQALPISITTEWFCHFESVLFSPKFAYAKFCEKEVLAKITKFTVFGGGTKELGSSVFNAQLS